MRKCGEKMCPRKLTGNLSMYMNDASISKINSASNSENLDIRILSIALKKAPEFGGI